MPQAQPSRLQIINIDHSLNRPVYGQCDSMPKTSQITASQHYPMAQCPEMFKINISTSRCVSTGSISILVSDRCESDL